MAAKVLVLPQPGGPRSTNDSPAKAWKKKKKKKINGKEWEERWWGVRGRVEVGLCSLDLTITIKPGID
jgi:hypothetical protein